MPKYEDYDDFPRYYRSNQTVRAIQVKDAPFISPKGALPTDWLVYPTQEEYVILSDGMFRLFFAQIES